MSGLRSDMPNLEDGYVQSPEAFDKGKVDRESKMMRLGPDKLTISKLDNIELREITGTTRSNINSRNQT
jgi:hypothetical protein